MIGPGGCPSTGQCEDYLGTRGHGGTIYSARWSVVCQVVGRVAGPTCLPRTCSPVCSAQSSAAQHYTSHHPALPRVLASWSGEACVNTVIAPMLIVLMVLIVLIEALPMLTLALAGHSRAQAAAQLLAPALIAQSAGACFTGSI